MAFQNPDLLDYSAKEGMTPMLTNVPESAQAAAGMGRDVYFLSDRPETEQFLQTQATPYKFLLRDKASIQEKTPQQPTGQEVDAFRAWKDFKPSLQKTLGYDPESINPAEEEMKARNNFLEKQFGGMTSYDINAIPHNQINRIYSEADKYAKAAGRRAEMMAQTGAGYRKMFFEQHAKDLESRRRTTEKQLELSQKYTEAEQVRKEKEQERKDLAESRTIDNATRRAQIDPRWTKAETIAERENLISEYVKLAEKAQRKELAPPKEKVIPPKGKLSDEIYNDPKYHDFFAERLAMAAGLVKDPLKNKEKVREEFKKILTREGYF